MGNQRGDSVQQLGHVGTNADTRVANAEELIGKTTSSDEESTDDPGTKCAGRHTWVIMVIDDSTDLGVRRVLNESHQGSTYMREPS